MKILTCEDLDTWLWEQDLDETSIGALGYSVDLEGWVAFLRSELELDVAIGRGVPTALERLQDDGEVLAPRHVRRTPRFESWGRLGSESLIDHGMTILRDGDGYRVTMITIPGAPLPSRAYLLTASYVDNSLEEVVDHLNLLLANRGLPPVEVDASLLADAPAVDLTFDDVDHRRVLERLADIVGGRLERVDNTWHLRSTDVD